MYVLAGIPEHDMPAVTTYYTYVNCFPQINNPNSNNNKHSELRYSPASRSNHTVAGLYLNYVN